tara:strand:- start:8 stop:469 length:462 start_codon:yes stop_codon:yes gene_type:complete
MTSRTWASNSFWTNADKNRITTILTTTDDDEKITTQQLTVNRFDLDGNDNPDFKEIIDTISEDTINENTEIRRVIKENEQQVEEQKKAEFQKSNELQKLFEAKIQAFEIETIKNSTNRIFKSKLRKAQNIIEVNIYSMMIVMEELNNAEAKSD